MRCFSKLLAAFAVAMPFVQAECAQSVKILAVDTQRVFESYNKAKASQDAYGEAVAAADKELKDMYSELAKLREKVDSLSEKSENSALTEQAREKYRQEAAEKSDLLRLKSEEFDRVQQDIRSKMMKRRNDEIMEHDKAIRDAVAEVAKSKKADIVLNKMPGTVYIDCSLDITDAVIAQLNGSSDSTAKRN